MNKISEQEWVNDFQEFVKGEGLPVPQKVTDSILAKVRKDLNPPAGIVFSKLLGIHVVVGTLSLAICNQFGLNPFKTNFSLSDYFMNFGHSTCMFLCGVLFLSLSVALSRTLLRPEEFLVVRKNALLQIFALSMISLGLFSAFGAELVLSFVLLWLVGSILGGMAVLYFPMQSGASNPSNA